MGEDEPGLRPLSAALDEEGFDDFDSDRAGGELRAPSHGRDRHLAGEGVWRGREELSRRGLRREAACAATSTYNGDLLVRRTVTGGRDAARRRWCVRWLSRRGSIPRPAAPADDANSASRLRMGTSVRRHWRASARAERESGMKLLRTIRLDPSDTFVFERAADPGEWAVSGAFMFADADPDTLDGKPRAAFRGGFLGVASLGWSTLVQIVAASDDDRAALVEMLARRLLRAPRRARSRGGARRRRRGGRVRGLALRSSPRHADRGAPHASRTAPSARRFAPCARAARASRCGRSRSSKWKAKKSRARPMDLVNLAKERGQKQ